MKIIAIDQAKHESEKTIAVLMEVRNDKLAVLAEAELKERKAYRTQIGNLVAAIQVAAIEGFALRCVAAGSLWATFELTAEEMAKLQRRKIFLEEDK